MDTWQYPYVSITKTLCKIVLQSANFKAVQSWPERKTEPRFLRIHDVSSLTLILYKSMWPTTGIEVYGVLLIHPF